jgi:cell division protein FtsW
MNKGGIISMKSSLNLKPLKRNKYIKDKKFDWNLVVLVSILSLFGILMIYSASSYNAENKYNDGFFYFKKQIAAFVLGLIFMIGISFVNLEILYKLRYVILAVSYILLALVFVPGLGIENYGAKRWINLGFFTFQASEISKFGLMIFISAYMSTHSVTKLKGFFFILFLGLIMAVLIMLEPNMSITMCVLGSVLMMLFIGGAKIKHFVMLVVPLIAGIILLIVIEPYRMSRLIAFIDPWASPRAEGYQLIQSYYSLGSGGLFGVGLFNSRQKYMFLPFSESDFILSIIGEELGLCGITLIMVIFIMLITERQK